MQVTQSVSVSLSELLRKTPHGKIAMFRVTSISSKIEDWLLGENVYVRAGQVWDFMSDTKHGAVEEFGLHFCGYIDR